MPEGKKRKNYVEKIDVNNEYPSFNNFFDEQLLQKYSPDNSVRNFHIDYVNSPKYRERLQKQGYNNVDQIVDDRTNRLRNVNITSKRGKNSVKKGSYYSPTDNELVVDNNQVRKLNTTRDDILAHELSHVNNSSINLSLDANYNPIENISSTSLSMKEEDYISNRNKKLDPGVRLTARQISSEKNKTIGHLLSELNHDYAPTENKSDLDAFRYILKQEGLYDTGTQDFNLDLLKKAKDNKNIKKSYNSKRLFDHFSDESIIELMNNIALSSNSKSPIAKNGINMPDPIKPINNPTSEEKARAARILELSKQWGVPTNQIFSQVKMRPSNSWDGKPTADYSSYWTFDQSGKINNSIRDYSEAQGTVYYTPQDIQLQQRNPGKGVTVAGMQLDPNGVPLSQVVNNTPGPLVTQRNMKWGGKIKKKKAQNGMQVPDPNNPYQYLDEVLAPTVFDNQRLTYLNDAQPVYGNNPANIDTSLQNPVPNIETRPVNNEPDTTIGARRGRGGKFGSVNINLGTVIAGLAGAANQSLERANIATQAAKNQRLTLQTENYNPLAYGQGSQAIYENGGQVQQVYDLTPSQRKKLESQGYIVEKIK